MQNDEVKNVFLKSLIEVYKRNHKNIIYLKYSLSFIKAG
jgi:hypothetical protein